MIQRYITCTLQLCCSSPQLHTAASQTVTRTGTSTHQHERPYVSHLSGKEKKTGEQIIVTMLNQYPTVVPIVHIYRNYKIMASAVRNVLGTQPLAMPGRAYREIGQSPHPQLGAFQVPSLCTCRIAGTSAIVYSILRRHRNVRTPTTANSSHTPSCATASER